MRREVIPWYRGLAAKPFGNIPVKSGFEHRNFTSVGHPLGVALPRKARGEDHGRSADVRYGNVFQHKGLNRIDFGVYVLDLSSRG